MHGVPDIISTITSVYNKRLAPKGHIFIVCTCKDRKNMKKYTMSQIVPSTLTEKQLQEVKVNLSFKLKEHFNL